MPKAAPLLPQELNAVQPDVSPRYPHSRLRAVLRYLGTYAGILAVALAAFSVAGAVWGIFRPTYTAVVEEDGAALIAVTANAEFVAFISFALISGIIAAVLALVVFLRSETTRGIAMLVWLGVISVMGSGAFLVFADVVAGIINQYPDGYAAGAAIVGEKFYVVPQLRPGTALFAAPFMAVCMYWCATFVSPSESPDLS